MSDASNYSLPVTYAASVKLQKLDRTLIGTPDYLGVACFWNSEYNQYLRVATHKQRKSVHDKLIAAGLSVRGASFVHEEIVKKVCARRAKKVYGIA